jgi:hypothetical protein
MRYLSLLICLASLSACGGSEAPRASKPEAAAKTDDVLFQDQRSALQKAAGVEDMVLDADAKRRAQMEAQE